MTMLLGMLNIHPCRNKRGNKKGVKQMASKYFSCAETAKMVRQALKEAFPDIKFSVKSKVYSGGASINIRYIDGPNTKQVEAIADVFSGAYFDGMTDFKGSTYAMIDGISVKFGADFIFVNRDYSDAMIQNGIDRVYRKYPGNFKGDTQPIATVKEFRNGMLWSRQVPGLGNPYGNGMQGEVYRVLNKMSDRMKVEPSPTAGKVIYLGNDGYSDVGALSSNLVAA